MNIKLANFVGDEVLPFKHRLFNVILILGIITSFWSAVINYVLHVDPTMVMSCILSGITLLCLYYLSIVQKAYSLSLFLTVFMANFIIIPIVWMYNSGTLGSVPLYIALFSPMGIVLFSGYRRFAVTICLIVVTNILLVLEYKYPFMITGYANNLARYIEISIGLSTTIIANALFYVVILNYYHREHEKVSNCLVEIEQQKRDIEFQHHLKIINKRLQEEVNEREQIETVLRDRNQQLLHEISERSRAERETNMQRRHLETILLNSPDMIVRYDIAGYITFISPSAIKFGLNQQELIGKDAAQIGHSKHSAEWWSRQFASILHSGEPIEFEFEMLLNDSKRCFYTQLVPEFDEGGEIVAMLGFFRDITPLKVTEKEMARLDRLNLIGQMAASIGHEVRNPLTTIRGFLQYFGLKSEFGKYIEEFNIMINELDRANGIITEFLSLAKTKAVSLTKSNLNHFITALYPLLMAAALEMGHNLELELGEIDDLLLDEKDLRQLILNLVHNGFDAIAGRGTVRLKTYQEEDIVTFAIQDNGGGIPQEVLHQLGTPFVTTKEKGTGLGLPVCYRIVERHNARLEVETSPKGTTFLIKFNVPRSA